jgi:hypothetical protein
MTECTPVTEQCSGLLLPRLSAPLPAGTASTSGSPHNHKASSFATQ